MGIRSKLILPLFIALIIIFGVLNLHLKPAWVDEQHEAFLQHQQEMLDTLSLSVISPVLSEDYAALYELLDDKLELNSKSWIQMVMILDDGEQVYPLEILATDSEGGYGGLYDEYTSVELITHELQLNEHHIGTIYLYADGSGDVEAVTKRYAQVEQLLLFIFAVLILAALTAQSMMIRAPIEKLQHAASALTLGEYDHEIPATGRDEIGRLASSFKKMRDVIQEKEMKLIRAAEEAVIAESLLKANQEALIDEHYTVSHALAEAELLNTKLNLTQNKLSDYKNALDQHAIVSSADIKGKITSVNKKFCEISGYTVEELIGNDHSMLQSGFHVPEYFKDLWDTIQKGRVWHGDICNVTKNGELYWVEATIVPFLDDAGNPRKYVAIRTDITDQVKAIDRLRDKTSEINQAHAELKLSHQQALHSEKLASVGQLAAGIAHEINTPIQFVGDNTRFLQDAFKDMSSVVEVYEELGEAISNGSPYDELLKKAKDLCEEVEVDYLAEEVPSAIEQTLEGVERVSKIVLSMKNFSHPGSDQKEVVDINEAIKSTVTVSRNEWKYDAELVTDLDENLSPVPCFVGEFNQVVLNIVINASHAIKDAKQDEEELGTITISTRQDEDFAEVRISDTGTGMPDEVKKKIFELFYTTKGVGKGSGQGLAIAYSVIVDKHHGTLEVESIEGEGTTFIIRLPMAASEKSEPVMAAQEDLSEVKLVQGGSA